MRQLLLSLLTAVFLTGLFPSGGAAASGVPRLVGTVTSGPFSGAVFDEGNGVQQFYRLNEQLPDGSRITKVRVDSIVVRNPDGSSIERYLTGGSGAPAAVGTTGASSDSHTDAAAAAQSPQTIPVRPQRRERTGRSRTADE